MNLYISHGSVLNIYVCETAFHVMESISISKQKNIESSYDILLVVNEPRVGDLDREELEMIFDRTLIGNFKLNLSQTFPTNRIYFSKLNSILTDCMWLLLSTLLSISCTFFDTRIYSGTASPSFITYLWFLNSVFSPGIYHFEDGLGSYTNISAKNRSKISRILYPYDLSYALNTGIIDNVYATHPDQMDRQYPNLNCIKIDLQSAERDIIRVFRGAGIPNDLKTPFLLLTQPLVSNGYLSRMKYRDRFEKLLTELIADFDVLLKPHPGEDIEYYRAVSQRFSGVELIEDNQNPAEIIAWALRDDYATVHVGSTGYSTAILNLSLGEFSLSVFGDYFQLNSKVKNSMPDWLSEYGISEVSDLGEI